MKRYENAKFFLTALDSSEPMSVNTQTILHSYHHARAVVLAFVCNTISRVTIPDPRERNALDELLQLAARLWLDACSQRFRLFVVLPESRADVLRLPKSELNCLQLVIKPELQRFGNLRGDDICKGESLTGWRSHIEVLPARQ